MPRNANTGVYTPPANSWNPATPDTVISSADWNALRDDMATALNHAPSTTRALHPTTGQVQDGAFVWGGTAGGTADALTLTLTPAITSYATGMVVRFVASADNTSATPTLSINGVTPAVIVRDDGTNLAPGDIKANGVYEVLYSGTQWRLTSITYQQSKGNEGAQFFSGTSALTLPDNAKSTQFIEMTVEGASVFLPDATLQGVGRSKFTIINNGKADFFVRPSRKMPLQNGDFSNEAVWTLGTGWSIASGVATKTPGTTSDLSQPLATEAGATYEITFTITTISGGSVRVGLVGGSADVLGTPRTSPGTYTETLRSNGNTTFVLRADAAFNASVDNVVCQRVEPPAVALLRPKQSASLSLLSNSTPSGLWLAQEDWYYPPKISAPAFAPTAVIGVFPTSCALDDQRVLHFGLDASSYRFAYVVDYKSANITVGTPVLVSTTLETIRGAHLVEPGKVLFCYGSNIYLAAINGTTVTVSSPVAANVFPDKREPGPGPKHAQIGPVVVIGQSSLQAIDCSGTIPAAGSAVTIGVGATTVIGVFSQPSSRVVCFYVDDSGVSGSPFSLCGRVATVSGTTITAHTPISINDVVVGNSYAVLEFSKQLYLLAYMSSSAQASVVLATVSGTSVTFHTPVSFSVSSESTINPTYSWQNEMLQKLSDTEAVMCATGLGTNLTFAHIKINGTTLTVTTNTQSTAGSTRSLIVSSKKQIYYNFGGNQPYLSNILYVLKYENNTWGYRRVPYWRAIERPVKMHDAGFIVPCIESDAGPISVNTVRWFFVSTKTENEQLHPIFCRLGSTPRVEQITSQKIALYGDSLPPGQPMHYLLEGVF